MNKSFKYLAVVIALVHGFGAIINLAGLSLSVKGASVEDALYFTTITTLFVLVALIYGKTKDLT